MTDTTTATTTTGDTTATPAPGATPPAATPPATPPAGATPPASPPAGSVQLTQDVLDWGKSKGYGDTDMQKIAAEPNLYKLMTSYRETEKMLGTFQSGDKLVIPKDATDKAGWDAVYAKLGRPEAADKYQMEIPQGGDNVFALEAGKWFHEAGLNQQQATTLNKQWNTYVQQATERMNADVATRAADEVTAVEKEWGANAKVNGEVATRGLVFLGKHLSLPADRIEAIKNGNNVTLSAGEALRLFKLVGDLGKTTGDTFEGAGAGERQTGTGMTPADAQVRLNTLQNDRAFYDRLQRKDATAIKERDDLLKLIAGGKVV